MNGYPCRNSRRPCFIPPVWILTPAVEVKDAEAIGRRLSLFGGAWAVERTVNIAARLIADRLNR